MVSPSYWDPMVCICILTDRPNCHHTVWILTDHPNCDLSVWILTDRPNCHLMVWILADCLNLELLVWILADPANCDLLKPLPGAQQVSSSEMQIRRRATTAGWQPPSQDISNCAKRGWRVSRVGAAIMTYQFRKDEFGLIYVWQSTWENSGPHKQITLGIDYSFKSEIDCFISTQNRNRF